MSVVLLPPLLTFELMQEAALVNFMLFLNILRSQKSHFEHFEREIYLLSRVFLLL